MLRYMAFKHNKFVSLWLKINKLGMKEYSKYVKLHGRSHKMAENCMLLPQTNITDPAFTSLGTPI